ncbi:hypothetical protein EJ04DRAFT_584404 [Polyplosphaeria fusca]|uniref:Uncharacterized protein n=1 Tax=Polyplosphaeria fusca TaxID=682080 RepID=A0A9P4UY56_9PLEO|nr:hypothetical protein EJ04DRAFT_584404 [Polyplosphaeria fusca]
MARIRHVYQQPHTCGCYFTTPVNGTLKRTYLPQVNLDAHTTVFSTASKTVLKQTFVNTSKTKPLGEVRYAFPIFDGVSVVDFVCQIGDRTIYGLVKEKAEARRTYKEAKERGENAALLEQLPNAADVFTTSVSNVPEASAVQVTITYIQELKHDAEVDGIRLTLPTSIAPRYGAYPGELMDNFSSFVDDSGGISLTVDVSMAESVPIKKVISPSHPIEVSLGSLSTSSVDEDPSTSQASATLSLGTAELEKDFVLQIVAKDVGIPQAILETHPTKLNQRALMTTLVPKFNLKSQKPEIIFIADRSGSMGGNIPTLIAALQVFLKSIPIGCMFNILSFGSNHEFLWSESKLYGQDTLAESIRYVNKFAADFGGTETFAAVRACVENRQTAMPTELVLLTDGDIWSQDELFKYIEKNTAKGDVRVFPIGIGGGVSSALIEGVARAGRGFAQMVANNEKLDSKIVRMLKGALTPHIKDYQLEVKYEDDTVDSVADSLRVKLNFDEDDKDMQEQDRYPLRNKPISLYDENAKEEHPKANEPKDPFAGLPKLDRPKILQTPKEIPPLFPFNRTCVYLLLSPSTSALKPKAIVLRGTAPEGPLELEIPVQLRDGEMIHQLAARKATQELEEGRGWISGAKVEHGQLVKNKHPAQYEALLKREAVRLGVEFQVGGKHCSFVAVEANEAEIASQRERALERSVNRAEAGDDEWDMVEESAGEYEEPVQPIIGEVGFAAARSPSAPMSACTQPAAPLSANVPSSRYASMSHLVFRADRRFVPPLLSLTNPNSHPPTALPSASTAAVAETAHVSEEAECEEDDDEDMGYGLFDGNSDDEHPASSDSGRGAIKFLRAVENDDDDDDEAKEEKEEETLKPADLLPWLIRLQAFNGTWPAGKIPYSTMKISPESAKAVLRRLERKRGEAERDVVPTVLATAIVVVFLEQRMAGEEEVWELVVEKARGWLEESVDVGLVGEVWACAVEVVGSA